MEEEFLSIAEAAKLAGKSPDSIRRLIKALLTSDANHPDIKRERLDNGSDKYFINAAYFTMQQGTRMQPPMQDTYVHTQETTAPMHNAPSEPTETPHLDALIKTLQEELAEKNRQIANFQERDREHNVLIRDLQRQLYLPAPEPTQSEPAQPPQPEQPQALPHGFFWQRKKRRFNRNQS